MMYRKHCYTLKYLVKIFDVLYSLVWQKTYTTIIKYNIETFLLLQKMATDEIETKMTRKTHQCNIVTLLFCFSIPADRSTSHERRRYKIIYLFYYIDININSKLQ